jgi:hypothetical protein
MLPGFDRIAAPAYLENLAEMSLDEVRLRRDECQDLENAVSYVRRVAHGRLDIVGTELTLRAGDDTAGLAELVERLPDALADRARASGLPQRAAQALEPPDDLVAPIMADLDAIVGPGQLGSLPDAETQSLEATVAGLQAFESDISQKRRELHDIIDELQAEIGRRYQTGEVSVDSLLN